MPLVSFMVKNEIVYWAQKFGIRSLFVLIQFEIDQIVHDRLNIGVTYLKDATTFIKICH